MPPVLPLRVPPRLMSPLQPVLRRAFLDPSLSFEQQRRRSDLALGLVTRAPRGTVVEPFTAGGVPGTSVLARGADARRRVVHLHGGGYCIGSPTWALAFAAALSASADCRVLLPDYRLAPEHPFPAGLDDSLALWRAVTAEEGAAALSGDSAGAGLAVATALTLARDGEAPPAALALVTPYLDLSRPPPRNPRDGLLTPEWLTRCAEAYAAGHDPADPLISPLHAEESALAALPPTCVVSATNDTLAPEATRFVERARSAGATVEHHQEQGLWHDFPLQAGTVRAADEATVRLGRFVAATWG